MLPISPKRILFHLLWVVFLDLVGFSMLFPLYPELLSFYLGQSQRAGWLQGWIDQLGVWSQGLPPVAPLFYEAVFFGGLVGCLYCLLQFVGAPFWGSLSDRIGRRPVLLLTNAGTAACYALWAWSRSFEVFLLTRLVAGFLAGNLAVANAAAADISTSQERTRFMGLIGAAFGLGFVIGPVLGGLCAGWNLGFSGDINTVFSKWGGHPFSVCAAVACVFSALNAWGIYIRMPETLHVKNKEGEHTQGPWSRIKALWQMPEHLRPACQANFVFMVAFSGMEASLTFLLLERLGLRPGQIGWVFVYIGLILAFAQGGLVRRLAPLWGEWKLAQLGFGLTGAAFAGMAWAGNLSSVLGCAGAMALGIGLASPALSTWVSKRAGAQVQGQAMGFLRSSGALGRAVGPLLSAWIYVQCGSWATYLVGCGIALGAWAVLFRAKRSQHHPQVQVSVGGPL